MQAISSDLSNLHYGTSAFEGIIAIKNQSGICIFRLDDHLRRLESSAEIVNQQLDINKIRNTIINSVSQKNKSCYIRPITFSAKDFTYYTPPKPIPCSFDIHLKSFNSTLYFQYMKRKKISIQLSSDNIIQFPTELINKKISGKYLYYSLLNKKAHEAGYDESIYFNAKGLPIETGSANILIIKDGKVNSHKYENILSGITLRTINKICSELSIPWVNKDLTQNDFNNADEVLLCNTVKGIMRASKVGNRKYTQNNIGPVLQKNYIELLTKKQSSYTNWQLWI